MQGNKVCQEKLLLNFQLPAGIPKTNFYHLIKEVLDLSFLYPKSKMYDATCSQKSIDPAVFCKF